MKICGIRNAETLRAMKGLDVDHIGFVFAPSKRRVTPEEAGAMIGVLRNEGFRTAANGGGEPFRTAGVFVNPSWEEMERVLAAAPLDIVQLHGRETPEFCRRVKDAFGVGIFKAVPIPEEGTGRPAEELIEDLVPYASHADAFLLDTYDPGVGGGSGRTFSWETIPPVLEWTKGVGSALIVAGGLHADNVRALLSAYRPDGVDVSSGVETEGVKDIAKIRSFVERVKQA